MNCSYPTDAIVHRARLALSKASGLCVDSFEGIRVLWVSVDGAVDHEVFVLGDVLDVDDEALGVSGCCGHFWFQEGWGAAMGGFVRGCEMWDRK